MNGDDRIPQFGIDLQTSLKKIRSLFWLHHINTRKQSSLCSDIQAYLAIDFVEIGPDPNHSSYLKLLQKQKNVHPPFLVNWCMRLWL